MLPRSNRRYPSVDAPVEQLPPSSDGFQFNSDPRDEDYRPDVDERLVVVEPFFVVTARRLTLSTTHSQKRKAKELDPRDGRCMLSNEREPSCSVEVCHLLARATKSKIVSFTIIINSIHCFLNTL